ncbi:hypothetical protein V6Z11_D13G135600 [Gossypium hirsutum]
MRLFFCGVCFSIFLFLQQLILLFWIHRLMHCLIHPIFTCNHVPSLNKNNVNATKQKTCPHSTFSSPTNMCLIQLPQVIGATHFNHSHLFYIFNPQQKTL